MTLFNFSNLFRTFFIVSSILFFTHNYARADDISLLPKYGLVEKTDAQKETDKKFIRSMDDFFKGDRKVASQKVAEKGWEYLRQGQTVDAMRRFNQAWLLDPKNGYAIWGMGILQSSIAGKQIVGLALFEEAAILLPDDLDFAVDHARAISIVGAQYQNKSIIKNAQERFEKIYARAPHHVMNLQNWAIMYFYLGDYAEAWKKVKLAEAAPRSEEIDAKFLAMLQEKMPRP